MPDLLAAAEEAGARQTMSDSIPDERLKLLFVCAHPAIDPAMHTPLMLQAVLGLDAAAIARAFVVAPGDDEPAPGTREGEDSRNRDRLRSSRIRPAG